MADEPVRTGQDVVREVLAALAPGELPYVETVLTSYRIEPWTLTAGLPGGLPVTWTPFVLGFVAQTVAPAPPARRWWRRTRSELLARVPDLPVPAFDQSQLRATWAAATDAATEHGWSLGDREAFAAAVVAAFSAGPVPRPRRPPPS